MRIAAIDYGKSTGIAVADVTLQPDMITLHKKFLGTFVSEGAAAGAAVAELLRTRPNGSFAIVLEKFPANSANVEAANFYHAVLEGLGELRMLVEHLSPGTWKPFADKNFPESLEVWRPGSKHERDAAKMLFYHVAVKHRTRKVRYEE